MFAPKDADLNCAVVPNYGTVFEGRTIAQGHGAIQQICSCEGEGMPIGTSHQASWVLSTRPAGMPDLSTATATARQKRTSKRIMPEPTNKLPDDASLTSSRPVAV